MLAASLFFVAVMALACGVVLEGSLGYARASAKHAAQHYLEAGLAQARAALTQSLASQIASATGALNAPQPLAAAPACGGVSVACPFTTSATFTIAGETAGAQTGNVSATNLQTYPMIAEGRVAATIVESVRSRGGALLATRAEYVTLRTFDVPPFVTIDGATDAAGARDVPFEADAGGCDPATPSSCDENNPSAPATSAPAGAMSWNDTRIHALRQCVNGGSGACASQPYTSADPADIAAQTPWFNANAQSDGWSR
jgi:hypothetical protein